MAGFGAAGFAAAFFGAAFLFFGAAALRATLRRAAFLPAPFLAAFFLRAGLRALDLALPALRSFFSFLAFFLSFRPFFSPFDFPFFLRFAMAAPWNDVMHRPPRRRAVGMALRSTQLTHERKSRVRDRRAGRAGRAAPQQAAP